jgi:hypothetical protein
METIKSFSNAHTSSVRSCHSVRLSILCMACYVTIGAAQAEVRAKPQGLPGQGAGINQVRMNPGGPIMGNPGQGAGPFVETGPRNGPPIIGIPGPGSGPSPSIPTVQLPSGMPPGQGNLPPPGAGPLIPAPSAALTTPAPPPAPAPVVVAPLVPPKPVLPEPPKVPQGRPTPGIGPVADLPPSPPTPVGSFAVPAPVPAPIPVAVPVTTPAAGSSNTGMPNIPAPTTVRVSAPGPPPQGVGPAASATTNAVQPVASPTGLAVVPDPKNPAQGAGTSEVMRFDQSINASGSASSRLQEILPAGTALQSSMQVVPGASATTSNWQDRTPSSAAAQAACVVVTFRPDAQRPATTLVDFTGDGLILSAVPDTHIQQVFARSGYNVVDTSKPARWCIAQAAARELVQVRAAASGQVASVLVQTNSGWQLMTQSQWAIHQGALAQATASSALVQSKKVASATRKTAQRSNANRVPVRANAGAGTLTALASTAPKLK